MSDGPDSAGVLHPHLVFGAWASALLNGRRVALLGDVSTGLAQQLADASARRVHAYDPDPQRLATAIAKGTETDVAFASVTEALDVRAEAFDAVVVPDLTSFDDPAALLAGAAAMLSGRGILILASPHESTGDGAPSYYELYDLVTAQLDEVRMLGVAPFVGYTLADFAAEGEPPVTVDTALAEAEEPLYYLVVAGNNRTSVDPYTLLQVPTAAGLRWLGGGAPTGDEEQERRREEELEQVRRALAAAEDKAERSVRDRRDRDHRIAQLASRLAELQTELERSRERLEKRTHQAEQRAERLEGELEASRAEYESAREALEEAHQEDLDDMLDRIAELEAEAEDARSRASKAPPVAPHDPAELKALRARVRDLEASSSRMRSERDAARQRINDLSKELSAARNAPMERQQLVREVEQDLARDLTRLEDRLKERGRIVAELNAQVRQSQLVGRQLVRDLERARAAGSSSGAAREIATLRAEVDALRQTNTRQAADLEAARWRVTELERQTSTDTPTSDVVMLEAALKAARDEIAQLRRELQDGRDGEGRASKGSS